MKRLNAPRLCWPGITFDRALFRWVKAIHMAMCLGELPTVRLPQKWVTNGANWTNLSWGVDSGEIIA